MRIVPQALRNLLALAAKAVTDARSANDNVAVVDFYPSAQRMQRAGGSRRDTYYWPGRRAAAALRTAGKTRRMR